jgi:hypothetical protein
MVTLTHVFFDIYVFTIGVFMSNDNVGVNVIITHENPYNKHVDVEKYMCQRHHYSWKPL